LSDYTPTTGEFLEALVYLSKYHARDQGDIDLEVVESEMRAQFDRWLEQVKQEAWDEGYWQGINGHTGPGNPYRDKDDIVNRKAVQS